MKVLHLTLKKHWFDMIASGEKKEEYREMKSYWINRLMDGNYFPGWFKEFDVVEFKNGYSKDARSIRLKCDGLEMRGGKAEWGAEADTIYFVIKLGEMLNSDKNPERSVANVAK